MTGQVSIYHYVITTVTGPVSIYHYAERSIGQLRLLPSGASYVVCLYSSSPYRRSGRPLRRHTLMRVTYRISTPGVLNKGSTIIMRHIYIINNTTVTGPVTIYHYVITTGDWTGLYLPLRWEKHRTAASSPKWRLLCGVPVFLQPLQALRETSPPSHVNEGNWSYLRTRRPK